MSYRHTEQSGFALIALLITIFFIATASIVTAQLTLSNLQVANAEYYRVSAQFAADAGLDNAIQSLNTDDSWTGSGGEVTLFTNSTLKTTYQTTVTDDATDSYKKYLAVTARTYVPASSTTPKVQRKFQIELRGVGGGTFSLVTGVGGLYMSNNSKIVGGNVYVNGEINMSNSAQIGLTSNPVDVKAAHSNCPEPADATYPRICNNGENGQPITLNNTASIIGEVQATNQTSGAGMSNPGLVAGSPPPAALPSHDRAAQEAAINNTVNASTINCSSGTRTINANLKILGNVSISGTCRATVQGDVWITGNLTLSNSAELIVQNGLTTAPNIMIDGSSGLRLSNSSILRSNTNATPVGFRMITYWSAASCSPSCADVTGTDLYNSRNTTTISLSNSASGPQTEFYARWSRVTINNSGNVGALVGQTIQLSNSGTITFGTSVTGVAGISAWVVESYKRTY
jgi:hypothetical protein